MLATSPSLEQNLKDEMDKQAEIPGAIQQTLQSMLCCESLREISGILFCFSATR